MQLQVPPHTNRPPEEIIEKDVHFSSGGYTFRALSWLDIAKKKSNVCALEYAALEIRQAIERIYSVRVLEIRTSNRKGKERRYRYKVGKTRKWKKAVVVLHPDHHIDLF